MSEPEDDVSDVDDDMREMVTESRAAEGSKNFFRGFEFSRLYKSRTGVIEKRLFPLPLLPPPFLGVPIGRRPLSVYYSVFESVNDSLDGWCAVCASTISQ